MPYSMSLDLNPKAVQKQTQRLMMTPQMQQAIHLLQLPILELAQAIDQELEQNPILEYLQDEIDPELEGENAEETEKEMDFEEDQLEILKHLDEDFRDLFEDGGQFIPKRSNEEDKKKSFLESMIATTPSLSEYLMNQAREVFTDANDIKIMEVLNGYMNENGLITSLPEEIANAFSLNLKRTKEVLKILQTFDPVGVGAKDVREVLLIQLKRKKKTKTIAYQIIEKHFEDLIHNRLPNIQKALKVPIEKIKHTIQNEIACLDLHPGTTFSHTDSATIIPDARLRQEEDQLIVEVNEDQLQPLKLNRKYLRMLGDETLSHETKEFIKSKIISAKWLMKNIYQRSVTLSRIADFLAKYDHTFFIQSDGKLKPLTMKQIAQELELHESTIARAIANKYFNTPRGLFPFRYFFSNAYIDKQGANISSKTVRSLIVDIIGKEDKERPLSDDEISKKISSDGIRCARRTVAKYRGELKIGNTQQRRVYS